MIQKHLPRLNSQSGVIIIGAFIITFFFIIVSIAAAEFGVQHYTNTRRTLIDNGAINAAEAAADNFMYQINQDTNYQGTNAAPSNATDSCTYAPAPVTLVNNSVQGKITYESCVQNGTISGEKIVKTTGKVYLPATATNPTITRKLKLVINQSTPASYNIFTGPGGLNISNNVSIPTGPVYVKGKITISNNATIGSATTPATVYAADIACGGGTSSYPSQCGSTSVGIATSNNVHVYGDTHVATTVDNTSRFTNPGATQHDTIPSIVTPTADHAALTAGLANSGTMASKSCSGGVMHVSGHYTGTSSQSLSVADNCTMIIDGDTWLDGNLSTGNNSTIAINSSLTSAPDLIIDGSTGYAPGNNNGITANSAGVGLNMYTFWSADASCRPNCTSVTGANLDASDTLTTINLGNNFSGAANTKFFAVWTGLIVGNNFTMGQLIGQRIDLNNNGSIVFGNVGGGGTPTWDVRYYEQVYN